MKYFFSLLHILLITTHTCNLVLFTSLFLCTRYLSRETGLLRTRTGTGDALAAALADPRVITAVEWYTLPLAGSPTALGGVHSLLAITVGHKRNGGTSAAGSSSLSSSSSPNSGGLGHPGARAFARSASMPVHAHNSLATRTPSPTSAPPPFIPSTALSISGNMSSSGKSSTSGALWPGAHVYVIEKADGDASYMVGGVYVSHWKDVAAQVHELAKYSLRGSDLCLVPEAQTMAGLYSLALGLGP